MSEASHAGQEQSSWHDRGFYVWLMVLLFMPIGLYGLYKTKSISPKTKKIASGLFFSALIIAGMFGADRTETITSAIKAGDIETLKEYDFKTIERTPVIYYTVANGTPDTLKYFLDKGHEVIATGYNWRTKANDKTYNAIFKAIEDNKPEMLSVLGSTGKFNIDEWTKKYEIHKAEIEQAKVIAQLEAQAKARLTQAEGYWPNAEEAKFVCSYLSIPAMAAVYADIRGYSRSQIVTMAQNTQGFLAEKIPQIGNADWYQPLMHSLIVEDIYDNRQTFLKYSEEDNSASFKVVCMRRFNGS